MRPEAAPAGLVRDVADRILARRAFFVRKNLLQGAHCPGRPVDAMGQRRFMQDREDLALQRLAVDLLARVKHRLTQLRSA